MTSSGVCPVASRHSVVTSARRCYLARPTCATFAKNQSRCTWSECPRSHDRLAGDGKGRKISSWCHGVYMGWGGGLGGGATASSYHQVYYYTSISNSKTTKTSIYLQCLRTKQTTAKMNNFDCHPRVLSLSSASTPSSSNPTTPF